MDKYPKIKTLLERGGKDDKFKVKDGIYSDEIFEYLKDKEWVFTEKIDGTNIRVEWDGCTITRAGRTDRAEIPPFLKDALDDTFGSAQYDYFVNNFSEGEVCLYGEGYGNKIQKHGHLYRSDVGFILFDVKVGQWWLSRENVVEIASSLGIDVIPTIGTGDLRDMVVLCENGFPSARTAEPGHNPRAEGVVARPVARLFDKYGNQVTAKLKYKDFRRD